MGHQLRAGGITRGGLPLPTVKVATGEPPFVIASRHPNGALTIATLGRTVCISPDDRKYGMPLADITLAAGKLTGPIGIFGRYQTLTLTFDAPMAGRTILAQDILDTQAKDITARPSSRATPSRCRAVSLTRSAWKKPPRGINPDPGLVIFISGAESPTSHPQ